MYTRFHVFTSFAQRFRHKAYMRLNGFANIAWRKALGKLAKHGREDSHFLFPPVVCTYLRAFPNKACFVPFSTKWRVQSLLLLFESLWALVGSRPPPAS